MARCSRALTGPFSIVEEARASLLPRMRSEILDLSGPQAKLFLLLKAPRFAACRRGTSLTPVIFDGDEQKCEAAEERQQKDENDHHRKAGHTTELYARTVAVTTRKNGSKSRSRFALKPQSALSFE